jgi:hypothetical protein
MCLVTYRAQQKTQGERWDGMKLRGGWGSTCHGPSPYHPRGARHARLGLHEGSIGKYFVLCTCLSICSASDSAGLDLTDDRGVAWGEKGKGVHDFFKERA